MIVGIGEEDVYHEAGHAAMFCYYNIPIQYVSVRPDLANGYAGMVVVAADEPSNGRAELEDGCDVRRQETRQGAISCVATYRRPTT